MKVLHIEPFLAHSDIEGGASWREIIRREICERPIFVALVTPDFHTAKYTEQEVGAAWGLGRPVLPICKDGEVPTGFIEEKQCVKYDDRQPLNTAGNILRFILSEIYGREQVAGMLTNMLIKSGSYKESVCLANLLKHESELTDDQLHDVAYALKSNPEVYDSFAKNYLQCLIDKRIEKDQPEM